VFLGAGASKAAGFPLTGELLPIILRRLNANSLFAREGGPASPNRDQQRSAQLHGAFDSVLPGRRYIAPDRLPLVTELLSLVDHALANGTVLGPQFGREDGQTIRWLLVEAIYKAIQFTDEGERRVPILTTVKPFVEWLLGRGAIGDEVSVLTSNYDLVVDDLVFRGIMNTPIDSTKQAISEEESNTAKDRLVAGTKWFGQRVDFGHVWRSVIDGSVIGRPEQPYIRLLKLHGSLNKARCPACEHTYVNALNDIAHYAFAIGAKGENTCHCGAKLEPSLVAPSFARTDSDPSLRAVWQASLEALRVAEEWILVGYSFPVEDLAIRSMFLRALSGRRQRPKITVVQRTSGEADRYAAYFKGVTSSTEDYQYFDGGLEAFVATITPPSNKPPLVT
jgi:hypothetical protein